MPAALVLVLAGFVHAEVALATIITRDADFVALNQNPFATGPSAPIDYQQTVDLPTARTDFPALTIPSPVPPAFFELGAAVTGDMSLTFYGGINPGRLNINYPVETTFTIPDNLAVGQTFSLGTASAVTPSGYTQLSAVPVTFFGPTGAPHDYLTIAKNTVGAPSLTTSNPGANAQVDFNVVNHNFLTLQGCVPLAVTTVCQDIVKKNLPSLGTQTVTLLSASTAGNVQILPGIPGVSQTFSLPQTIPLGTFADFTISAPNLAQKGTLAGNDLVASKTSDIASLHVSLDGLLSSTVLQPLGLPPLTGSAGPVDYSLLKADGNLNGGLFQNLDFSSQTKITLVFDHVVRARVNGVDLGVVGSLQYTAGDNVQLSPLGSVTTLHVQPVLALNNSLDNRTGIDLSAKLTAQALSASLGDLASIGPLVKGAVTVPLGQLDVFHPQPFPVDMKPVFGAPFDISFAFNNQVVSLQLSQVSNDGQGHVTYHFNVVTVGGGLFNFDVAGRTQQLGCVFNCVGDSETLFLPDNEVVLNGGGQSIDLGDIFCVAGNCNSAIDLSSLANMVHSVDVVGFNSVFFPDAAPDLQFSDPVPTDTFISHTASNPDPGQTFAFDPALFTQLTTVPEPGTLPLFGVGLLAAILLARRRTMFADRSHGH